MNVGLAAVPLLLAKLWSVIPRLFAWPPVESPAQGIERLAIALLVSSAIFEFVTGIMNAQYWYAFGFNFVIAHYYGAVIFVASLVLHVAVKSPVIVRAYRTRGWLKPLRDDLAHTRPEPADEHGGLVAADPIRRRISRRGLFAFVGAGSALLVVANAGQSLGGPFRLAGVPRAARRRGDFPVNKTAARAGVTPRHGRRRVSPAALGRRLALARRAARAAAAHGAAADRVRRGLDDDAGVDRRAARRARAAGRRRASPAARSSARCSRRGSWRRRRWTATPCAIPTRCWR